MIVGTAGHIDHGKTALIKALTGTDADRLPAEKSRGITLDLGFAYQHFDDGTSVSFLDVPGHEKLVRTMVAGAIGIDFVLFVVAADDGPMPQTREHLAILNLLGISGGAIVITKIDQVSDDRVTEVVAQMQMLTQKTFLAGAPVFPCAAITGVGVPQIARLLKERARMTRQKNASGGFRLAIDRAFTLSGAGLVVTGTVRAGSVQVGETLMLSPQGLEVRVRGLRSENLETRQAKTGQRCALNITGRRVAKDDIARGNWILVPDLHAPTSRIDVRLHLLPSETRNFVHWSPVHLHIGALDTTARVSLLDCKRLAPGTSALGQLVLDAKVPALFGDRFIIRDQAATRTLGGGTVIDPFAPQRRTRTPERLAVLAASEEQDAGAALNRLAECDPGGVDLRAFIQNRNLDDGLSRGIVQDPALATLTVGDDTLVISKKKYDALQGAIVATLRRHHESKADAFGASTTDLLRAFPTLNIRKLVQACLADMLERGDVKRTGHIFHLPDHHVTLAPEDEVLWEEVQQILQAAGADQPRVTRLAEQLGLRTDELLPSLEKMARAGRLNRVSKAYFLLQDAIDDFVAAAEICMRDHPDKLLTVGNFREATGVTRHLVMPLLEYFDRIGFTRRFHVGRQMRREWSASGGIR